MSTLYVLIAVLSLAYLASFSYRLIKLVWAEGAKGNEVETDDAVRIVLGDLWKLVTLPWAIKKAIIRK